MIPLMEEVEVIPYSYEAIYFRRRGNDPINNPSLRQSSLEQLATDLFGIYNQLRTDDLSEEGQKYGSIINTVDDSNVMNRIFL